MQDSSPKRGVVGHADLKSRIGFVVELSRRLHEYGTAAPRLEDVINSVGERLGLVCNVLSTPTSIVMSFADRERGDDLAEFTQVVRSPPGDVNLAALCRTDEIANRVIAGEVDLAEGRRLLREVGAQRRRRSAKIAMVASYGVASAAIAIVLGGSGIDAAAAALNGALIGVLALAAQRWPSFNPGSEAMSAFVSTLLTTLIAAFVAPLAVRAVVIASLIVLMPGLTLTTAVRELSSQHLISGTARTMGAVATLLKLTFGTIAAVQVCNLIGVLPHQLDGAALPKWVAWCAVAAASFAFASLFRSPRRHYPVVIVAVLLGYACTQVAGSGVSPAFGTFVGGAVIAAASNLFARITNRPGALVREPGIIMLVPGSVGFRTLSFVFDRDASLSFDTAITLVTLLVAIVAGLLVGDFLIPPRRQL